MDDFSRTDTAPASGFRGMIARDAQELGRQLFEVRKDQVAPNAVKSLRSFSAKEVADLIGIDVSYLRQLAKDPRMPQAALPEVASAGRRFYTLEQIGEIRRFLDATGRSDRGYVPGRRGQEHMQIISVVNYKGGSGKTTTAAHLAQYFALKGYRVLAIDMDPQASMTALFGVRPEFEVGSFETFYGVVTINQEDRRPVREIIRKTYFTGLDLIPGNIELGHFEFEAARVLVDRQRDPSQNPFDQVSNMLYEVDGDYDIVVIDCPPTLGFLTMSSVSASTGMLITLHPQMLDVMSLNQFLFMCDNLFEQIEGHSSARGLDWLRYLGTKFEPTDRPQIDAAAFLRTLFEQRMMVNMMLKSSAISDATLRMKTLYEVALTDPSIHRATYERAIDVLNQVNGEVESFVKKAWGRAV